MFLLDNFRKSAVSMTRSSNVQSQNMK